MDEQDTAVKLKRLADEIIKKDGAVVITLSPDGTVYNLEPASKYVKEHAPVKVVEKEVEVRDMDWDMLSWEDVWFRH
ncbi:MAG: hypothetical protein LUE27_04230 [Clostridia bacterium]|nr:hypothetical protein [Clostridia bacterium]